jgi:hypothetical protein
MEDEYYNSDLCINSTQFKDGIRGKPKPNKIGIQKKGMICDADYSSSVPVGRIHLPEPNETRFTNTLTSTPRTNVRYRLYWILKIYDNL